MRAQETKRSTKGRVEVALYRESINDYIRVMPFSSHRPTGQGVLSSYLTPSAIVRNVL